MFRKIAKKIVLIVSAINIIILSACSSVSNLTPQKVAESESGVYTLTMAAKVEDQALLRGSEKPYIVIDGKKHLMQAVLNLKNEIMYQYSYTFPKDKSSVEYYYVLDYKIVSKQGKIIATKSIQSDEIFILKPLTKTVSNLNKEVGTVGTVSTIQGSGFDSSDIVLVGGKEATTTALSKNVLEFIVPILEANKRYDVEVKHSDGDLTWAGIFYLKPADLMVSPLRISKESGQVVNMIFDIGTKAPKGGYYIDVQTNIPSSVIMPEVLVAEGETSVAIPVKFAAAGSGALFINAVGFREKTVSLNIEAIVPVEVELLNNSNDEISENTLLPEENLQEEVILIEPKE